MALGMQSPLSVHIAICVKILIMNTGNPFARDREGDTPRNVNLYKAATIGSWLLNVIFTFMYVAGPPHDGNTHRHTLFGQSNHNLTPFTPSHTFISVFW